MEKEIRTYGINTGFGRLSTVAISKSDIDQLQRNLIMSHSTGLGPWFSTEIVRAMMALRINALAKGLSGIRLETLETLLNMLNKGVHPLVPERGSVGASGDLCPRSLETLEGVIDAFDPRIHAARPHKGQMDAAKNVVAITEGSNMVTHQSDGCNWEEVVRVTCFEWLIMIK